MRVIETGVLLFRHISNFLFWLLSAAESDETFSNISLLPVSRSNGVYFSFIFTFTSNSSINFLSALENEHKNSSILAVMDPFKHFYLLESR